jgi:hypothetical protein
MSMSLNLPYGYNVFIKILFKFCSYSTSKHILHLIIFYSEEFLIFQHTISKRIDSLLPVTVCSMYS